MTETPAATPASPGSTAAGPANDGAGPRRLRGAENYVAFVPFLAYVGLFLIIPTLIVATGAFTSKEGGFTLEYVSRLFTDETFVSAFIKSIQLAVGTAILGAVFGALLAWAVARGDPNGQTLFFKNVLHVSVPYDSTWLFGLTGLVVVYAYFQIPLMVIVFLPSLDGLRQEWYDASASLGGGSRAFWRHVGGPILAPSFLGALLLLFTNAFSAYATAAALISQGSPIVTLQISNQLQSEVVLGQENMGKALALGMIVVVSLVMTAYALIQRRASRWVR